MRRVLLTVLVGSAVIVTPAQAKWPNPLRHGFTVLRPGQITGLDRPGCVGGFVAQTVPYRRNGVYRWDTPDPSVYGRSYIALQDTNHDGYWQADPNPGLPVDGYSLSWTIRPGFDGLTIENVSRGKVAVKIWWRC